MGRHESDPVPFRDKIRDSGPMKRIRNDAPTEEIPAAEVRRRAWPVVLLISTVLAGAVALPVGLSILTAEEGSNPFPASASGRYSATPSPTGSTSSAVRPTATSTKKRIKHKPTGPAPAPEPGPTVTETVYVTPAPKTIYVTAPPKTIKVPGPTKTISVPGPTATEMIYTDRCFRVRNSIITGEITCP